MLRLIGVMAGVGLLVTVAGGSAIPIWELLRYEEKMGRLMYVFVHLVEDYCKTSTLPDCRKVMTLYGVSNLLNNDEAALDLLDPDQRNGSRIIWQAAVKSKIPFPTVDGGKEQRPLDGASHLGEEPIVKVVVPPPETDKHRG